MELAKFFRVASITIGLLSLVNCSQPAPEQDPASHLWDESFFGVHVYGLDPSQPDLYFADDKEVEALFKKGGYLVNHVAACGQCHSSGYRNPLSGGESFADEFGEVLSANITPDEQTGIGSWTIKDIVSALRTSVGKDEALLSIEAHKNYRWLSDEDARAIAVYLFSVKPVENSVKRRELSSFSASSFGLFAKHEKNQGYVPAMNKNDKLRYGQYLSDIVARCTDCHVKNEVLLENVTQDIIEKHIASKSEKCPTDYYKGLEQNDLQAISAYLAKH